jgi:diguanylate cyclase (GGDEF)-like protein
VHRDSTDQFVTSAVLKRDRRERRNALIAGTVASELPVACLVTAAIFFLFGIVDAALHPAEAGWRLASSEIPAFVLGVFGLLAVRGRIPARFATAVYGALVVLSISSTVATVIIGKRPEELIYTLLLTAAAGAAVPSFRVYVVVISLAAAGYWLALALLHLPGEEFTHWLFAGAVANAASIYVLMTRRRSLAALVDAQRNIEEMAVSDNLTGVMNRNGLRMMGEELLALAHRRDETVFALFVDVDGLKRVNDENGHEAGDALLALVGQQLEATFRRSDVIGRWGGDEFVVVGIGEPVDADDIEQRLCSALLDHVDRPSSWTPSLSAGVAVAIADDEGLGTVDDLIANADHDMYRRRGHRRR